MANFITMDKEKHHLEIKGNVPSKKNSKRRVKRGAHVFMIPSAAHEAWHGPALWDVKRQWPSHLTLHNVEVAELIFYHGDKRANDLSNKAESVMDLLVDAGVIADDNWFVVPRLVLIFGGVDKQNPRVVIHLH